MKDAGQKGRLQATLRLMLSYQHTYHAGGPADIHKHAILSVLLHTMVRKAGAITYAETHAGRGHYNTGSAEAHKTGEAAMGVGRLTSSAFAASGHPLAQTLRQLRATYGPQFYPGSPRLAHSLLRPHDSLHLAELHPGEHAALQKHLKTPNVHIYHEDGYRMVNNLLTGTAGLAQKRGLVLVDPSFEVKSEYAEVATFLANLHANWPAATLVLWYPLLADNRHTPMIDNLRQRAFFARSHHQTLLFASTEAGRMYGSGVLVINPPFNCQKPLQETGQTLQSFFTPVVTPAATPVGG